MNDWKTRLFRRVDNAHRAFNDRIKDRWPLLSVWLYHKPRARFLMYRIERRLLAGKPVPANDRTSVVLFTVNKAASMYVHRMLRWIAEPHGLLQADLTGWFATSSGNMFRHFKDPESMQKLFRPKGFFYAALRDPCDIPGPERFRIVVVLRDPRDVLTSKYYSQGFSHAVINERVHARRKHVVRQTIDTFVLEHAPGLLKSYQRYVDQYDGKPYALITTYEKMTADLPGWLNAIVQHTGLTEHPEAIQRVLDHAKNVKATGDKSKHIRVARSGDHQERLQPATIAELDRMFAPLMRWFPQKEAAH